MGKIIRISKHDDFFTVPELARIFKKPEYTIRDWLRNGFIKGERIGKSWHVPKKNVDKFFPPKYRGKL
ncbi:MAG: helix-turn-helix domain-containing protein [Candidatus Saganbacteria bacterium]|nr:helix-turn-helix domain-containing protein [Candidatus Saganbacteria bacterium]